MDEIRRQDSHHSWPHSTQVRERYSRLIDRPYGCVKIVNGRDERSRGSFSSDHVRQVEEPDVVAGVGGTFEIVGVSGAAEQDVQ